MKAVEEGLYWKPPRKDQTKSKKWDKYLADYKNYFKEYKRQYKSLKWGSNCFVAISVYEG
jgi:hypothetical protein